MTRDLAVPFFDRSTDLFPDQVETKLNSTFGRSPYTATEIGVLTTNTAAVNKAALQAWVDSVAVLTARSRTVEFGMGTYDINAGIVLSTGGYAFIGQGGGKKDATATARYETLLMFHGDGDWITNGSDNGHSWAANEYDGPEGHRLTNISFGYGGGATTETSLTNGGPTYAVGTCGFRDWRGGALEFHNVQFDRCEWAFWGVQSDQDVFHSCVWTNTKRGFYLGPRSDQATFINPIPFGNDTALEIDGAQGFRCFGGNLVANGSTTTDYPVLLSARLRKTSGIAFYGTWFEQGGMRAASVDACIGSGNIPGRTGTIGSGFTINGLVLRDPVFLHNATPPGHYDYVARIDGFTSDVTLEAPSGTWVQAFVGMFACHGGSQINFLGTAANVILDAQVAVKLGSGTPRVHRSGYLVRSEPAPHLASQFVYASQGSGVGVIAASLNRLLVTPIHVPRRTTFDQVSIEITTGSATGVVRLGLYADDGTGKPGALITDFGPLADVTTNGVKSITINQTLDAGWYFIGAACSVAAVSWRSFTGFLPGMPCAYGNALEVGTNVCNGWGMNGVSGALLTPFVVTGVYSDAPRVALRVT